MPSYEDILLAIQDLQEQINALEIATQSAAEAFTATGDAVGVPTGQVFVGIFMTACPAGWTRQSQFDAKTIYGATTYGATGGVSATSAPSHTHAVTGGSHTHTAGASYSAAASGTAVRDATEGSIATGADGGHTHTVANAGGGEGNWPPYRAVVFCSP